MHKKRLLKTLDLIDLYKFYNKIGKEYPYFKWI